MKMMLWFGFLKDGFRLLTAAALAACINAQAAAPAAIPIFADNFESGTLSLWTATGTSPLEPSTAQNVVPAGGQFSALMNTSIDRMHHNIIADNGGVELDGHILFTCWIYDLGVNSGTVGATRVFNEIRGYSGGTGLPNGGTVASGTLAQLLAVGKFNSVTLPGEVFTATKYQGRVAFHTPQPAGDTGWLNLNGPGSPNRSVGWHRFDIEVMPGGTTVRFYVDGILSRTFNGATPATYDTVVLGPGLGSQQGDAWIDGMSVGRVDLPPVINCPTNITVAATSGAGAVVNYTVTATDDTDTNVTIVCNPPSGSTFPIGQTPVTCTATDDTGNTTRCEFLVTVTPPVIFEGFEVYPKGQAVVQPDQSGRRLPVRNIGSSGQDGIDIALRGVDALNVSFVPYDYLAETCTASSVEIEIDGAPARLRSELALGPGLTTARADFSALGSTESEIEIRAANNQLLDRYRVPNGTVIDIEKLFPQCPSNTVVYSYFQGPDLAWFRFCKPTCFPCVGTNCWVERVVCIRGIIQLPREILLKSMQLCFASQGDTAITIEDLEFMELGNQHHGKPDVLVDGSGPGLRMNINGIGRTGTLNSGGVMVKPPNHNPEARRIDVELVPLSLMGVGPAPGGFMLEAMGTVNGLQGQSLGTASLRQLGGPAAAIQMAADFSQLGATMVRLDVLNNGQPVGRAMLPMGNFGTLTGDGLLRGCGKLPPRPPCFFVTFNQQMRFTGNDGTMLEGDEFRILAGDATVQVQALESLCLMAANLDFTIVRESIQSAGEVFFPDDVFPPPTATWGSLKQEWDTYGGGGGGGGGVIALRSQKRAFFDPASPLPGVGQTVNIQFGAIVEADVSTDGGQSSRCMDFRGGVRYQITGGPAQGDTRSFDIEILSMDLGAPLGQFRLRESPTKQSLGRLSVRQLPTGGYMMESFFDVFTEFSVNGGNSWIPGDGAWLMELLAYAVGPFAKPNLPPAGGSFPMQCAPVDFANQMLVRNLVLLNLSEGPPLDQIPPGGTVQAEFQGGCSFEHSRDGGQTWQPEQAECRATFVISHVLDYEGGTRYFDTEMLQLDIQGGSLPTAVRLRESPTRRSLGRTCLGQSDSGQALIGSFFDVFTEITIDGGQSYALARRPARLTLTHGGNDCIRIVCPSDIRVWTCEDGAVVNYTVTATSQCGSIPVIECRPPSGSFFPIGTTVVDCRARDAAGNVATCSFKVEVVKDSAPPTIVCPNGPVPYWICTNGTPIHFSVTATDDCDTNVTIVCNPPSGTPLPPGNHLVTCEAIDDCGKRDRCEFVVTVRRDTEPPRLICPEKIEICTCNPNGTNVTYTIVATDDCDTNVTVVCNPPSGSFFTPGTTTVTCTARDDCGNTTDCSFPVTVTVNRVAITCPPDIKAFTCSNSAVVNYVVDIATRCAGTESNVTVICNPPSGSAFPIGTTTVTCRATNECGFSDSCQFRVTVEADQEPPRIICPNGVAAWTCSDGAVVNYTVTATDDHDTNVTINCNPPSGSVFPVGVTIVNCVAIDDCGKADRCEFPVRVIRDTEPPRIVCPTNIVVVTCRTNARVHYSVTASDDCDTNVTIVCTPPSGSLFPLGTTTVHCIATDDCGNKDECRFEVVVRREPGPRLTIRPAATTSGFLVCWPAPSPGWRLQCSPTLNVPNVWQDVTNAPVLIGSQWCVLLPNNARHRFYRLCKPCDPVITGVSHLRPREGDVLTITGSGFGNNPDNLCVVIVERSLVTTNGPGDSLGAGLGDGVRYIPLRALSANDTFMTARMGPVPPDAKPGHIMVGHGIGQVGRFRPAFPDIVLEEPVWTWNKFGPAGMGEDEVEPQPEPNPPATERCFHSGPPQNGELCVFIQGDWGTNCYISIVARAHDSTTDTGGHDLDGPTVRFLNAGTTRDCVERIVDVLRCAFQQQAGVQIEVTFEEVPPGSGVYKITVRIPGGYIDRGMLTICVRCPDQPAITDVTPTQPTAGQVIRVRGTNFPTDPDDICMVALNGNSGEFIPFHVLDSTGTEINARLGPVPPNAQPGRIMIGVGEGTRGRFRPAFFDIFVEDDVWTWRKRGPVALSPGPIVPIPVPAPPSNCWFFSGPPVEGKLCVFLDPNCPWPSNATVSVVARAHDATTGAGGHDLAAPNVRFVGGGSLIECAGRVADILRCAFQQQAGVTVHVDIDLLPDGRVKLTVSIPGGHIDRGMLTICVGPPSVAGGP